MTIGRMQEHHIVVPRTARYYTLGDVGAASELWCLIHGYSQLARRFLNSFRALESAERLLVAPEAHNRYYSEHKPGYHHPDAKIGATWMTREHRESEIHDYVQYLDRLVVHLTGTFAQPPRRIALGFSQGVATAARWAASGRARLDHLVLWGGWLPPELTATPDLFHGASLTFVYGTGDDYTPEHRVNEASAALEAAGLRHRVIWFDGGHEIRDDTLRELAASP